MLSAEIEKFKALHIEYVRHCVKEKGLVNPILVILAKERDGRLGHHEAPVIVLSDDDDISPKDIPLAIYKKRLIPTFFEQLKNQGSKPLCFSFAAVAQSLKISPKELLARTLTKEDVKDRIKDNFVIYFEAAGYHENIVYDLKKVGLFINRQGKMVDNITLEQIDKPNTLSVGLFEKDFQEEFK